jgi:predicted signal transduction protein with EAL and GGDEF domain
MVGDELLIAASRRLESCLRQGDALARMGGDEFAIFLNGLTDDAQANAIACRIQDALSEPFSIAGREVFTSASIGIAFAPGHYCNPDEIMRDADTAMYHAKSRGKSRHEVFDAAMHARVRDRLSLENDLRRAVAGNDFEVHYQPIVALTTGMCVGFESLVRWTRNGEPVSPVTFVPIAEELGLIEPLGTWVLQEACRTFANWQRQYPAAGLDCITVNVSSRQLVQQNFPRVVQQAVRQSGLRPADLRVEITGDGAARHVPARRRRAARAARLRRQGLSRRLRHRLLVAEPPAQAAGGRAEDRSLVRQQPAAARPSRHRREHPRAGARRSTPAWWPKGSRATCRRASSSASAARTRRASCSRGRSPCSRPRPSSWPAARSGPRGWPPPIPAAVA